MKTMMTIQMTDYVMRQIVEYDYADDLKLKRLYIPNMIYAM